MPAGTRIPTRAARRLFTAAGLALAAALPGCALFDRGEPPIFIGGENPTLIPEVPWVVSSDAAVEAMLELARVRAGDAVYDLGCGDGRIVIAAAKRGARGTGIDIDPYPIGLARYYARRAGVEDRVRFIRGDFFEADLRGATVVTLYLSLEVNRRLLPKLLAELAPGARIVSQKFDMGDTWAPERTLRAGDATLYLWTVPADRRVPARK